VRLLFCLPTTALSGGVKVIFELTNRLINSDEFVDVFSFANSPKWFPLLAKLIEAKDIEAIDLAKYDFVLVSNAFMVPLVLSNSAKCRCVFFCQDYESFHHAKGKAFRDYISDCETFTQIYKLPVPIISISRAVQSLIRERVGRDSFYLPVGINRAVFRPKPRKSPTAIKRVLMVGNYLMPYKGMRDGFDALRKLCAEVPLQLVIVTQESRGRAIFDDLPYPIELHFCPPEDKMPDIIASCDLYCCTSWYEGLGLPALEAFCCGVPVVSTSTYGVSDYGIDGVNLLLARPNDSQDIYEKLRRTLLDESLAERLREAAFKTVTGDYDWKTSVQRFKRILREIHETYQVADDVDPRMMRELLERLEHEGNLTPTSIFRRFQELSEELEELNTEILSRSQPTLESLTELQRLRSEFRSYLDNENTEYYDAFKSKYDFCQLLLSLKADPHFIEYLQKILTRRNERGPRTASSFSEVRYSHSKPRHQALD
jgi:glycosyltransferase involved in cell wall biosynthesis